jgi:hypothetical protein
MAGPARCRTHRPARPRSCHRASGSLLLASSFHRFSARLESIWFLFDKMLSSCVHGPRRDSYLRSRFILFYGGFVMGKRLGRALGLAVLLAVVVVGSACNKNKNTDIVVQGNSEGVPPPGMGGGPQGMGFGGPKGRGPIGQTMTKLFKGRPSLKDSIGQELNSDSPSWDTIKPQTKEFAEQVASLSKYDPPKGGKDSWTKLTTAFSEQASALDRAAAAKNKNDALTAYSTISESCKACHQAHRGGPGGGMGMPPGGFRGKGGPPGGPPDQPQ